MQKMMYLLVSQYVSGIIMPIIRRTVQSRQRLWCTALVVLQKTRGEEVFGVHLLGLVSRRVPVEIVPINYSNLTPRVVYFYFNHKYFRRFKE
jgi:hypothetical protein